MHLKNYLIICLTIVLISSFTTANAQQFPELGIEVETVAENLKVPWAIAFAPDGRIFFTERGGQLRVIENGQLNPIPIVSLQVGKVEGGLLGMALDPDFEINHYLYLYHTYNDSPIFNKVVRFTISNNQLSSFINLIDLNVIRNKP